MSGRTIGNGSLGSSPGDLGGGWTLEEVVENPWGQIPLTGDGSFLPSYVESYMARVQAHASRRDATSRKHHYVPKAYLRQWAGCDGLVKRIDTATGSVEFLPPPVLCRRDGFYRVTGPEGSAHNQVEKMLAELDSEGATALRVMQSLTASTNLTFETFLSTALAMALQYLRTPQHRRLISARADWIAQQYAQASDPRLSIDYDYMLVPTKEVHVTSMFDQMWQLTDELVTRQLYVYDDSRGLLPTCDAPVLVPLRQPGEFEGPNFVGVPRIWWPISPTRALCFEFGIARSKFEFRQVTGRERLQITKAVVRGRERYIFAPLGIINLPTTKVPARRQLLVECVSKMSDGSCRIKFGEAYAKLPQDNSCGRHKRLLRTDLHS